MIWHTLITSLIWTHGMLVIASILLLAGLFWFVWRPASYGMVLFLCFAIWFFRNPVRTCPEREHDRSVIVCPADGKVVSILFGAFEHGCTQKVSIALSLLDAHVQWIPCDGSIVRTEYRPGDFCLAYLPKSSERNERNDVVMRTDDGHMLMVRQIAGTVCRRICCFLEPGQSVGAGQGLGMIRFGSRVELFLPTDATIEVGLGQQVLGGNTVIARWDHS